MINLPKASAVDGRGGDRGKGCGNHGHERGGDHKSRKVHAAEACDEGPRACGAEDAAPSDASELTSDAPGELPGALGEAEEQVAFFAKKMLRAKDKLKDAKQVRGYFAKKDGATTPRRGDGKIAEMKARALCGARGEKGHWRGDPQCKKKNDPNARAEIPHKGGRETTLATNEESGSQKKPRKAAMTIAPVYTAGGSTTKPPSTGRGR